MNCPCRGCQRCLFSVFQAHVSFKIWSKAWLRELCSLWLFSNTFVYMIVGVDRLDKDLTIGQMQGEYVTFLLQPYCNALFAWQLTAMGTLNIQTNGHERICLSQSVLLLWSRKGGEGEKGSNWRAAAIGFVQSSVQCSQEWSCHTSLGSEWLCMRASF